MLNNIRGAVPAGVIAMMAIMSLVVGASVQETYSNGILKKNTKKIWCKILNKGQDYCDNKYQ